MKILNFGSLNVDHVYQLNHFVCGGETEHTTGYAMHMGGKGLNQSVALARAGAQVYHAGCVGSDGAFLTDYLAQAGVHTEWIQTVDIPTGHAIIQVEPSGQNCILLFGGANQCVTEQQAREVLAHFAPGDILLLQNEISALAPIMRLAQAQGLRIAFNPSPVSDTLQSLPLEAVDWFILNEVEGAQLTGTEQPEAIAAELLRRWPDSRVVLTLGKRGVLYRDRTQTVRRGIFRVCAVDTTAAGDTFTGYFLAGAAAGHPVEQILADASKASALAVTRPGAAETIPTAAEVAAAHLKMEGGFFK